MKVLRLCSLCLFVSAVFIATGMPSYAEPVFDTHITAETADMGLPIQEDALWAEELPMLEDDLIVELEFWQNNTSLPGPELENGIVPMFTDASDPGTVSVLADMASVPTDTKIFAITKFGANIPAGFKSNVMESSVGAAGKWVFFTGNWFAARTTKGGGTRPSQWQYVSSFTGMSDFCCDQIAIYDESRDRHFWLRMGLPGTDPKENRFGLSVSADGFQSWWTYWTTPLNVDGSWTNQWWDYPHIQLGADFLYMTWNMFNQADQFTRTVVLRWPLDELAAGQGFSYDWFETSWFTLVPTQGAYHKMYFASNWPSTVPQNNRLGIWSWEEDSTSLGFVERTVAAWTVTSRGDAVCGSTSGNWAARYDQRVLAGARYSIMNSDLKYPGKKVIAWWWNVAQGGSFPQPYIDAAAVWEDTLSQVSGLEGRPLVWNSSNCFAYPSVAANKRQDLGMVFHYSKGANKRPFVGFSIADDITAAPPGWTFYKVVSSNARPADNVWGDYNTVREYEPTQKVWAAGSHFIEQSNNCTNCGEPIYFVFGRERDWGSWRRWRNK
jgi:hypothetical protein